MSYTVHCPACRGEGQQEWRRYAAGASPEDCTVTCNVCSGIGTLSEGAADRWIANPTLPPEPRRSRSWLPGVAA